MEGYYTDRDQQINNKGGYYPAMDGPNQLGGAYYMDRTGETSGNNNNKPIEKGQVYFSDRTQDAIARRRANFCPENNPVVVKTSVDKNKGYYVNKEVPKGVAPPYYSQNVDDYDNPIDSSENRQMYGSETSQNAHNYYSEERSPPSERPPQTVRSNLRTMASILKELKESILKSNEKDKKIILKLQNDHLKNKMLTNQLEEIRKENKHLKNFVYQKYEQTVPKTSDPVEQTFSNETLPNKYGDMLSYYEGLLNILQNKVQEIDQYYFDNGELREHIKGICGKLVEYQRTIGKFFEKNVVTRQRHIRKINQLKRERDSLRLAYDKMVDLLNKQNLERALEEELQKTVEPDNEQRTSDLHYQNVYLRQEVEFLKGKLKEYETLRKWDAENQMWMTNATSNQ